MTTLFISDLHLDTQYPEISAQFLRFLREKAPAATALYILGDLFEAWIGDDAPDPEQRRIIEGLRELADSGTRCYFMRGNRDFLIGEKFCRASGCRLLSEPARIELYGQPVLLLHGDSLCTDDTEYQQFRAQVRSSAWQAGFLALPVAQRRQLAAEAREQSRLRSAEKPAEIMDVNQDTVEATLRAQELSTMLHGHTHRPAIHRFDCDGRACTRIVLGDWYQQGSVLRWDAAGYRLEALPRR